MVRPKLLSFCRDLSKRGLIAESIPLFSSVEEGNTENFLAYSTLPNNLYVGFDPTASSLHVGNLLVISNLLRSSRFGCQPFALIGEATALVGDPSGRTTGRTELDYDYVQENSKRILKQLAQINENARNIYGPKYVNLKILNNMEWYEKSHDWHVLSKEHDCYFQLGGSDQLGHLSIGRHYIRDHTKRFSAGICLPLIVDEGGNKLGKSEAGSAQSTIWLDERKTSAYDFYQYFKQLRDDIAERFLMYFSLGFHEEVKDVFEEHKKKLGSWIAQTYLADEMTQLIHGKEKLKTAQECSKILFHGNILKLEEFSADTIYSLFGSASTVTLPKDSIEKVGQLADATNSDTKEKGSLLMSRDNSRFIVNGKHMTDPRAAFKPDDFLIKGQFTVIRWGKRRYSLVRWT
ncbi:tRNA synthetases class I (W and y) domain-containing protein [Ditylenchus destructor]|uniref:tyrosine--tRNA ligase n=1 Tax=Ditylenchus destructor TaxID=166010 RepID=A0AAD4R1H2_9BILA|nr:tRNA synthetases class I (W and y) domain-containing protein [Ditylenchus destructor]